MEEPFPSMQFSAKFNGAAIESYSYAYDDENRLASVASNGIVLVANEYDYRGRRIRKTTPTMETTFVYDGWNLIHETVSTISGATTNTTEIQYFWGVDLSETLQGAGGVGGLLAVSRNGDFYFPAYDNNGNITKYIDESGNVVAAYEYDAFGKTISQTGSRADFFRHRFSTKYYDAETGLYYYGYRFYAPTLMRWLNRDPIGENGDINQYMFVKNTPLQKVDSKGLDWRIARNGGMFAHAIATKNDDTFEMLAGKLRLDVSDYKIWAHTSDAIPRRCKKYKIPNLVVYDYGGRRFMDRLPTHIISLWRGQNNRQAENDEKKGLMVLIRDNVSSGQIESILRTDGLYKYTFTGHGDGEGGINAYPYPFDVSSPVARYTKYGISSMVLQACGSAAIESFSEENRKAGIVKHNNWELNVAKAGVFIGYEGAVTLLNELFQWTAAKGANYGVSE